MPIYVYKNTETEEIRDVFLSVSKRDSYKGENGDEDCWVRQISKANVNVDSSSAIDPFSKEDFQKVTRAKKGTVGDIIDLSEELSEKRAEANGGVDPVKKQHFKDYEKKHGQKHQEDKQKVFENESVRIELD